MSRFLLVFQLYTGVDGGVAAALVKAGGLAVQTWCSLLCLPGPLYSFTSIPAWPLEAFDLYSSEAIFINIVLILSPSTLGQEQASITWS